MGFLQSTDLHQVPLKPSCDVCRWDARARKCRRASLSAFAVARPFDITEKGVQKRAAAVTEVAEASWVYKYAAKKSTDIGVARWIVQVRKRAVRLHMCLLAQLLCWKGSHCGSFINKMPVLGCQPVSGCAAGGWL